MNKEQALEILMLLSALESWGYANKLMLPDYLSDRLADALDKLQKEVLK